MLHAKSVWSVLDASQGAAIRKGWPEKDGDKRLVRLVGGLCFGVIRLDARLRGEKMGGKR